MHPRPPVFQFSPWANITFLFLGFIVNEKHFLNFFNPDLKDIFIIVHFLILRHFGDTVELIFLELKELLARTHKADSLIEFIFKLLRITLEFLLGFFVSLSPLEIILL